MGIDLGILVQVCSEALHKPKNRNGIVLANYGHDADWLEVIETLTLNV